MVSRLIPSVQYSIDKSNAKKRKFYFAFAVLNSQDIKVVLDDGSIPIHYSVMIFENSVGGYVEFSDPFAVGTRITIYRDMAFIRETRFRENQDFHASVINEEFDRMIMLLQQAGKLSLDSLRQARYDVPMNMELPDAQTRANTLLGFDHQGKPEIRIADSDSAREAQKFANSAKKDADIATRNRMVVEQKVGTLDLQQYAKKDGTNLQINTVKKHLDLGTAADKDVGVQAGQIPVLDGAGKIPKDLYVPAKMYIRLQLLSSGYFFKRLDDGTIPPGINHNRVWSLEEQKASFGGVLPQEKNVVELPGGILRITLAGGGAAGSVSQYPETGRKGSYTGCFGQYADGGMACQPLYGRQGGGTDNAGYPQQGGRSRRNRHVLGTPMIYKGKGGAGGQGGGYTNTYGRVQRGNNGGKMTFILNFIAPYYDMYAFTIGAGGKAEEHDTYNYIRGMDGEDGYIEVEYMQ